MSTRNARHVRQRKLNTKQPLRIIRENEIEETLEDEAQRLIPQFDTGVEKGEEVEVHLQAVINAANASVSGLKTKQSFIPTPDATKARDVKYDELYPKGFASPYSYIRFSSTVEDSIGTAYCMNEEDEAFLSQLNDGKDVNGQPLKEKSNQCSEDVFEEVIESFEETSQRLQPFANVDANVPILTLDEIEQARETPLTPEAQRFQRPIYQYWAVRKRNRALMPTIKVRVLDTTSEADDADPYVCFRRREVRQTRKTRGRDAQVVEKLKKLRIELEQARQLVDLVRSREELNKQNLEISRKVFEERRKLKEVKVTKNIVGEKGEDEELLVNTKPTAKTKGRGDGSSQRPATIRLRSVGERSAPENDLISLADLQAEAEAQVNQTIENRKFQHRRWNSQWHDGTWGPLTPPADPADKRPKWSPLFPDSFGYPSPPPSLPSPTSQDRDGDTEMANSKPQGEATCEAEAQFRFTFSVPPPSSMETYFGEPSLFGKDLVNPSCRLRYGRGGRVHLEARRPRPRGALSRGVVSDSDSDDEMEEYYPVSEAKTFDYRCALNSRARPEGGRPSGDQAAIMAGAQQAAAAQQSGAGGSS
ncbi:unnamed protein product [Zymoseptoria tritici ST99CH_1E4]|uniref:Enhancer of polycomb-like protein n=1 Tax=Zymoseptoria tritici ST99CH_1E4 TaxID=1276532 RepID=A0A2H1GU11_ZYMTR|nr:unnamed protein product [Zymoseptoria tritici ST99CH_1E4]